MVSAFIILKLVVCLLVFGLGLDEASSIDAKASAAEIEEVLEHNISLLS